MSGAEREMRAIVVPGVREDGAAVEVGVAWSSWLDAGGQRRSEGWVTVACPTTQGVVPWSERCYLSGGGMAELIRGLRAALHLPWVRRVAWLQQWEGMSRAVWAIVAADDARRVLAALESWPVPQPLGAGLDVVGLGGE